jgi:hypothetical protein
VIQALRVITVVVGAMLLGMSVQVFVAYAQKAYSHRGSILPLHVASIAISYSLLIVVSSGAQLQFLIDPTSLRPIAVTWRLPLTLVAYALGIYALTLVIKLIAARPHPAPLRRADDPDPPGTPRRRGTDDVSYGRRAGDV